MEIIFTQEGDDRFTPEYLVKVCGKKAIYFINGPSELRKEFIPSLKKLGAFQMLWEEWDLPDI